MLVFQLTQDAIPLEKFYVEYCSCGDGWSRKNECDKLTKL